jgi:uncharacterized protein YxeA
MKYIFILISIIIAVFITSSVFAMTLYNAQGNPVYVSNSGMMWSNTSNTYTCTQNYASEDKEFWNRFCM